MSRVVVPNLASGWKAWAGASAVAIAISLIVGLVTGDVGASGMVLAGAGIFLSLVKYRQERATRSQTSPGHTPDSN